MNIREDLGRLLNETEQVMRTRRYKWLCSIALILFIAGIFHPFDGDFWKVRRIQKDIEEVAPQWEAFKRTNPGFDSIVFFASRDAAYGAKLKARGTLSSSRQGQLYEFVASTKLSSHLFDTMNGNVTFTRPEITKLDQVKHYFQVDEARSDKPVVAVILSNLLVTDETLEHLKDLANIKVLALSNTEISDAGLVHLRGLVSLEHLYMNDTQVSDIGLEQLKGLTKLRSLNLSNTQVTDAGLDHLSGLTQLELLNLSDTNVTKPGAKGLQQLLRQCRIDLAD